MATITSTTTGNWSAGGTWVGGIAPVIGDKVIIAHTSTGLNTFSTNATGYAIGSTNITLTGSVLAGSYVVNECVQFGTDPNYYRITAWNNVTKVLTVDPLIVAIPASDTLVQTRGHVVTVDTTGLGGGDDTTTGITVSGTLRASRTANSLLRSRGQIWKELAGKIDWGSESDPIPSTYTAYIELNDSATQANNKYGFVNNATANNTAGFSFWGATKTRLTTVSVSALSTDTVITVADASGWVVGDIIVFDGTVAEGTLNSHRYRKISAIAGNNVTISANLGYASPIGRRVCNLTSNVRIYGVNGNSFRTQVSIRIPTAQTTASIVEIGETEFRTNGGSNNTYEYGSLTIQYESQQATVPAIKKIYRPIAHHVWDVSGSTVTKVATGGSWSLFNLFSNQAARYTIDTPIGSSDISGTNLFYWYSGTNTDIVNPIAIRLGSGIASCGFSQGPVGTTITGGYISLLSSPVYNTGVKIAINGLEVDGINNIGNQFAFGSYTWTNCIFGRVFGYLGATNLLAIATGASIPALFDSCTFYTPTVFTRSGTGLNNSTSDTYFKFRNKSNDVTQNEILRRGGRILRDNSTTYRGVSSLAMYSWYSANPLVHTDTVTVQAGQTVRVLGYCRYNTTYGTTYPTTLALSMPNVTTVTYTCPTSGANTWYPIDLSITNSNTYPVTMTLTYTAQSGANTETATAWFDGITVTDFVTATRHYGFQFTNTVIQTEDSFITQTNEATVGAYTGISINTGTSTITLTSDHSIQEIYDYCKWYLCQTANLGVADFFTTTDGIAFTSTYNLTLNGGDITGTGTLNLGSNTLTRTTETSTVPITYNSGAAVFGNVTVSGFVANSRIRLNNDTDNVELYNVVVAGTSVAIPATWTADKALDLRVTYVNGATAKLPYQSAGTLTSTLASFTVSQVDDDVYIANAISGSTITEFATDYPNLQVDIDDGDGVTTVQRLYAWYQYATHSSQGIVYYFNGLIAQDATNYKIVTSVINLELDNVSASSLPIKFTGAYLFKDDGTTIIYSGSKSIQIDPSKAYIANSTQILNNTNLIPALL
jgi:hypothetical protein